MHRSTGGGMCHQSPHQTANARLSHRHVHLEPAREQSSAGDLGRAVHDQRRRLHGHMQRGLLHLRPVRPVTVARVDGASVLGVPGHGGQEERGHLSR